MFQWLTHAMQTEGSATQNPHKYQELTCDNLARNLQRFEGGGLWLQANQAGDTQPRWHFILDPAGSQRGQTRALNLLALELQAGKNSSHGGPWTGQVAVRPL